MQECQLSSSSASSNSSSQGDGSLFAGSPQQHDLVPAETSHGGQGGRALIRTKPEAQLELQVIERQRRFVGGMQFHLASCLRKLEEQEQQLLERLAPPSLQWGGPPDRTPGRRRNGTLPEPQTPELRHLLALDPLAHLASPMTPLQLDDEAPGIFDEEMNDHGCSESHLPSMTVKRPRVKR
ncbi:unnamed protein product [Polarella glacialis]|uniref:Uncharacterized protein n=1 Tax=Polarella glacialis TaxID=89957 RepID=A0A813JCA7_POLGL|nr:unnamed protein product [Polarella glacialis]|mmetsp:Transcript_54210/g.87586  ORF Transcript_54210/g.87586 Transcript_54210/m.87586 type:complete len:181 (-) Transcript_54210:2-544(-)